VTKQTGLGDNFYVAEYDLSGDTNSIGNVGGGPAPIDQTGIDKSAFERVGGLLDGRLEWVSYFNPTNAHLALGPLPTSDRVVTYARGTTLGSPAASFTGKQIEYDPTRGQNGELTIAVSALPSAASPVEWGMLHTAGLRTDTAATNGIGVDSTIVGGTAFGLQAFLHVISFTGTSVTVKIQGSSDNGAGDAFADIAGASFTAATGATSQRIETATDAAIERYLRVVTTGTFSSAVFAVNVVRNFTARGY
jgi:hypothetical protein